ncbi:MAG: TlpA family protein disulfide reductase [Pseudomonadales bacterium]
MLVALLLPATMPLWAAPPAITPSVDDLNQYHGKVVLLDFWASWCGPCRRSFPWMNQLLKTHAGAPLHIVAVNLDAKRSDADQFLKAFPADFEVWFDPQGNLARHFDVGAMPTSILLDPQGGVIAVHRGFLRKHTERYEATVRQALLAHQSRNPNPNTQSEASARP